MSTEWSYFDNAAKERDEGLAVRVANTKTEAGIQEIIDELHRSAARNIALAEDSAARFPWRRHDVRIYRERAEADLIAARHLLDSEA